MTKAKIDQSERIVKAAMSIAAEKGWVALDYSDIAKKTRLKPDSIRAIFPEKTDILLALNRQIDTVLIKQFEPDREDSVRDRLFEGFMLRFDLVTPYRAGLIAVMDAAYRDPCLALKLSSPLYDSVEIIFEKSIDSDERLKQKIRVSALTFIYLSVLRSWRSDKTADMAVTMAALDKHLRFAERLSGFLDREADNRT